MGLDDAFFAHLTSLVDEPKLIREKGSSIISFPDDYIVIDTETTGLDPSYDEIIEVAAIKYVGGKEVGRFSELVQPSYCLIDDEDETEEDFVLRNGEKVSYVSDFITELTGITNEMLNNARMPEEVLAEYLSFIGDSVIVGHNVNFDVNFIYDAAKAYLGKQFANDYIDTMRIARKLLKDELQHHRLKDLVKYYNVSQAISHRALADCEATNDCYTHLKSQAIERYGDPDSFIALFKKRHTGKSSLKGIQPTTDEIDEDSPCFGKIFVFTGALDRMLRKDAAQLVVNRGGICGDNITKKTNYLVLGCNDYCTTIKNGKSTKQKKAEQLKLEGNDIEIISENVFYEMLEDV